MSFHQVTGCGLIECDPLKSRSLTRHFGSSSSSSAGASRASSRSASSIAWRSAISNSLRKQLTHSGTLPSAASCFIEAPLMICVRASGSAVVSMNQRMSAARSLSGGVHLTLRSFSMFSASSAEIASRGGALSGSK